MEIVALPDETITETLAAEDVAGLVVVETTDRTDSKFDDQLVNLPCFDDDHQIYIIQGSERIVEQADIPVGTPSGNLPYIPQDYLPSLRHPTDHITRPTMQVQKKRHRDRLRKRELRLNDDYKKKDRASARQRMKKRRKDPLYRSIEREKDRMRRQEARRLLKLEESKNNEYAVNEDTKVSDGLNENT
ncbi:uncharacterized protein [Antedon mediterranea]|uniref:uncharacterized protein isoform X1 n=1 Tax=Antedon mediterranea TaxID=105859 RepID=UPI003AF46507